MKLSRISLNHNHKNFFPNLKSFLCLTIFSILFFVSCDIELELGLGSRVDTDPPKIEILQPLAGETIRDAFYISGIVQDDGNIQSVSVEVKGTGSNPVVYGPFEGSFDKMDSSWKCLINPLDPQGIIPDGTYEFEVTIADTANHANISTRQLIIDNTAPILAIKRPSRVFPENHVDSVDYDSYGQDFIIEGSVGDTCEQNYIAVKFYDAKTADCIYPLNPDDLELKPIDTDFSTTITTYGTEIYNQIYGDKPAGTKVYVCGITVYDNAKRYPISESLAKPDDKYGNSCDYFYMYNGDLYNDVFHAYHLSNAYKILNGSFTEENEAALRKEAETYNETINLSYKEVLKLLQDVNNHETKGFFSLNPENNPSFKLTGHNPITKDDYATGEIFNDSTHHIQNTTLVVVEVSVGLDQFPILKDTLGLYLTQINDDGTEIGDKIWLIKPLKDKDGNLLLDESKDSKAILERDKSIKVSGETYKFTYSISTEVPTIDGYQFLASANYKFGVCGYDTKGVEVKNTEGDYAFQLEVVSKAPVLNILDVYPVWVTTNTDNLSDSPEKTFTIDLFADAVPPYRITRKINGIQDSSIFDNTDTYTPVVGEEGPVVIEYCLSDKYGVEISKSAELNIDNIRPIVTEYTLPNVDETQNISYKLTGVAEDKESGIAEVQIKIEDVTDSSIHTEWVTVGTASNWIYNLKFTENEDFKSVFVSEDGKSLEGDKKVYYRAIDNVGNISEVVEAVFTYDTENPLITINKDDTEYINAATESYIISGTIADSNKVGSIIISTNQILYSGSDILIYSEENDSNFKEATWSYSVPLDKLSQGQNTFKISATDISGRTSASLSKSIYVDTKLPKATAITIPDITETEEEYFIFSGTAEDEGELENSSGISKVEVQFVDGENKTDWITATGTTKWKLFVTYSEDSYKNVFTEEGEKTIKVRVIDEAGNYSEEKSESFVYDKSSPVVTVANLVAKATNYFNTSDLTIYGTAVDSHGISKIQVIGKNGTVYNVENFDEKTGEWNFTLSDIPENENSTITVKVFDDVEKFSVLNFDVYRDESAPSLSLEQNNDAGTNYARNNFFVFSGMAEDLESGIDSMEMIISSINNGEKTVYSNVDLFSSTKNWSKRVYDLEDGNYEAEVIVKDKAGNTSSVTSGLLVIDTVEPVVTLDVDGELYDSYGNRINGKVVSGNTYYAKTPYSVIGTIEDVNFVSTESTLILKENESQVNVDYVDGNYSYSLNSISDGVYSYSVTVKDEAGNQSSAAVIVVYDTTAPKIEVMSPANNEVLLQSSITPKGIVSDDGIGVDNVYYYASSEDKTIAQVAALADDVWESLDYTSGINWSKTINLESQGTVFFFVKATDILGHSTSPSKVIFSYDKEIPQLQSINSLASNYGKDYDFTISGKAGDTNNIKYVKITDGSQVYASLGMDADGNIIDSTGTARIRIQPTEILLDSKDSSGTPIKVNVNGIQWSINFTEEASQLAQGVHNFNIVAVDTANRESLIETRSVLIDTILPEVTIETPSVLVTKSSSLSFSGTAADTNLENAIISLYKINDDQDELVETTILSINNGNWNYKAADVEDGNKYYISVQAEDIAGNRSDSIDTKNNSITVDYTKPVTTLFGSGLTDETATAVQVLSENTMYYANNGGAQYSFSGVITDANEVTASMIVDGSTTPIDITVDDDNKWNFYDTLTTESVHTYTLKLRDVAGNETNYTLNAICDSTAPETVVISAPTENRIRTSAISDDSYIFSGRLDDSVSKVARLYYSFSQNSTAPSNLSDYQMIPASNGNWNIERTIDTGVTASSSGNLYEGSWYLHIKAMDAAGNVNANAVTRAFDIDKYSPELTDTSVVSEYINMDSSSFTLKGKVWDTHGLSNIKVSSGLLIWSSEDENSIVQFTNNYSEPDSDNWSITFVTGENNKNANNYLPDGDYIFTVTAEDRAGKRSKVTREIILDTASPSVINNIPITHVYIDESKYLSLNAAISDGNAYSSGIAGVFYILTTDDTQPEYTTGNTQWYSMAKGASAYTASFDVTTVNNGSETDATRYAWIAAEDNAGNITISSPSVITIDEKKPIVKAYKDYNVEDGFTNIITENLLHNSADATFYILVEDSNPSSATAISNYSESGIRTTQIYSGESSTGESRIGYKVDLKVKVDGSRNTVTLTGWDANNRASLEYNVNIYCDSSNPVIETITSNANAGTNTRKYDTLKVEGSIVEFNLDMATVKLLQGSEVKYTEISGTRNAADFEDTGIVTFTANFSELADGIYNIYIHAIDTYGNEDEYTLPDSIYIDTHAPIIGTVTPSLTSLNLETKNNSTDFEISAVITDAVSGIEAIILSDTIDGVTTELKEFNVNDSDCNYDSSTNTYTFAVDKSTVSTGSHSYRITAIDKAGNSSSKETVVNADVTPPTMTISGITPTVSQMIDGVEIIKVNGKINFSVNANDETQLKEVFWNVDNQNSTDNPDNENITFGHDTATNVRAKTWAFEIDTSVLSDKTTHRINVTVTDTADNPITGYYEINVDQDTDKPRISISNASDSTLISSFEQITDGQTNIFVKNGRLIALISDDDGVGIVDVNIKKEGAEGEGTTRRFIPTDSPLTYNLSYSLPEEEGSYIVTIEVKDTKQESQNQNGVNTVYVVVDSGAPIFSGMTANGGYYKDSVTITGTLLDSSNIIKLARKLGFNNETEYTDIDVFNNNDNITDEFTIENAAEGADSGNFVTYKATDRWGQSSTYTVTFLRDTTAPSITRIPSFVGNQQYISTIKSTAIVTTEVVDSGSGMTGGSVYYTIDNNSTETDLTASSSTYTGTIDFSSFEDGVRTVKIFAKDRLGNVTGTSQNVTIIKDTVVPDFHLSNVRLNASDGTEVSADFGDSYFTTTGFIVNVVSENDSTAELKVNGTTVGFTSGSNATGNWSYSQNDVNGKYEYTVTVTDKAGNSSTKSFIVTIDHSAPSSLSISKSLASKTGISAITDDVYSFTGQASDGAGGTGVALIYYSFVQENKEPDQYFSQAAVDGNWTIDKSISEGTTRNGNNLCEGTWYLFVKAADKAGNTTAAISQEFEIDKKDPEIVENQIGSAELYKTNSDVIIKGTATDSNNLDATAPVTITVNGKTWNPVVENNAWSQKLTVGEGKDLPDGNYSFYITVKDKVGKSNSVARNILVDTTDPVITVDSFSGYTNSSTLSFSGSIEDDNLSNARVTLYKDGTLVEGKSKNLDNAGGWTWTLTGLADGEYTIKVNASDRCNNSSEYDTSDSTHKYSKIVDTTVPVITFVNSDDIDLYDSAYNKVTSLTGNSVYYSSVSEGEKYTIKGTVTDANLDVSSIRLSINGNSEIPLTCVNNSWSHEVTAVDGNYKYLITASDKAGNTRSSFITVVNDTVKPSTNVTAPAVDLSGTSSLSGIASYTFKGVATDSTSGVKEFKYLISQTEYTESQVIDSVKAAETKALWNSGSIESGTWIAEKSITVNEGSPELCEGKWYAYTYAKDYSNNESATVRSFWIDLNYPELSVTASPADMYTKGNSNGKYVLSGTATDANNIESVTIVDNFTPTITGETGARNVIITNLGAGGAWSHEYAVGTDLKDGTHIFTITAKDNAGKTNVVLQQKTVVIDTVNPSEVTLSAVPTTTDTMGSSFTFTGTADDATSGIAKVDVTIYDDSDVSNITTHTATAVGTTNWSLKVAFDDVQWASVFAKQGQKKVYVKTIDKAGNWIQNDPAEFMYDTAYPSLKVNAYPGEFISAHYTVTGEMSDSNALGDLIVKEERYANNTYTVTERSGYKLTGSEIESVTTDIGEKANWNVIVPLSESISAGDIFRYTFILTDSVGNEVSSTQYVTSVDTHVPTVDSSKLQLPNITETESNVFVFKGDSGCISDTTSEITFTSGFDRVDVLFTSSDITPDENAKPDFKVTPDSDGSWKYTYSFADSTAFGTEGTKYIWLKAYDIANNSSEWTSANFIYDKGAPSIITKVGINIVESEATVACSKIDEFNFSYTITESNGFADDDDYPVISVKNDGNTLVKDVDYTITQTTENSVTRGEIRITEPNNEIYTYYLYAKDFAGKESSVTRNVRLDTTAPEINISIPSNLDSWQNSTTVTLIGTASDISVVKGVYYYVGNTCPLVPVMDSNGNDDPVKVNSWTAKNWSVANGTESWNITVDGNEGENKIYLAAVDVLGNTTEPVEKVIKMDAVNPGLTEDIVGDGQLNTRLDFSLSGKVWDKGSKIDYVTVTGELSNGSVVWSTKPKAGERSFTEFEDAEEEPASNNWKIDFSVDEKAANKVSDGAYQFKILVKDKAGRTTSIIRNINVDTHKPTIVASAGELEEGANSSEGLDGNTYYNKNTLPIIVAVSDGTSSSGISSVEYSTDESTWIPLKKNGSNYEADVNCPSQGINIVYIRATDLAGNVSDTNSDLHLYVDTQAPVNYELREVNGKSDNLDDIHLVTGLDDIVFKLYAEDNKVNMASNGVAVTKIGSMTLDSPIYSNALSNGVYTVTIPADKLFLTNDVLTYVYVTLKDDIGNSAQYQAFQIKADKKYPKATMSSIADADIEADGTQVNGIITISGTASDRNEIASVVLQSRYAQKSNGGAVWGEFTEWENVKNDSGEDLPLVSTEDLSNWTFNVDTTTYPDNSKVQFRVQLTDKVGNVGNSGNYTSGEPYEIYKEVYVNQDSDRPVIRITNLSFSSVNKDSTDGYYWYKFKDLTGTVSDDDGAIKSIKAIAVSGNAVPTEEQWNNALNLYTAGGWSLTFENNGSQKLYFKVEDAAGNVFISNTSSTTYSSYGPKIIGSEGNKTFGYTESNDIVYVKVDTIDPKLPRDKIFFIESDPNPSVLDETKKITAEIVAKPLESEPEWSLFTEISGTHGGANSLMYLMFTGTDDNGIYSSTLTIGEETITVKSTDTGKETLNAIKSQNDIISAVYNTSDSTSQTIVLKIDTSKLGSNTKIVEISTTDNAGSTFTYSNIINFDNYKPSVSILNQADGAQVFGSVGVTARGSVTEHSELYFAITKDIANDEAGNEIPPENTQFTRIDEYTNVLSWSLVFDGVGNTDSAASTEYHGNKLNDYLISLYDEITEENISSYSTVTPIYLWMYAVDDFNNISDYTKVQLNVNPQGDKPTASITYPNPDVVEKVGGTIRINGGAEIATKSIASIWIQIDPNYDGNEFSNDWISELKDLNGTLPVGYTIVDSITGEIAGLESDSEFYNAELIAGGIKTSGSVVSWNLPINIASEFTQIENNEGEKANRTIAIRVYAISSTGKVSDPVIVSCEVDPESPVFGNSEELRLVQFDEAGKEIASQKYAANMWISDQWYLVGTVEDDSGIKSIIYSESEGNSIDILHAPEYSDWCTPIENASGDYPNYRLKIPVGKTAENQFGTLSYKFKAIEGASDNKSAEATFQLQYDNKKPEFAAVSTSSSATVKETGNEIYQSDGIFTINGTFTESSSGNVNQSGFNRIAMFFTRPVDDADKYLIDPMVSGGEADGKANFIELEGLSKQFGLYWKEVAAARIENANEIILPGDIPDGIRNGGLCMVNKVIYRINEINGSKLIVDGVLVSEDNATVYLALAQVIDNMTIETISNVSSVSTYGSGADPITNGDDDWMIEGVMLSNGVYNWNVSINSANIYDGLTNVNFVAFDAAGNYTEVTYGATVRNNGPRFAGVSYGTDDNGDGVISDKEIIKAYSGIYAVNGLNSYPGIIENGRGTNKQFITNLDTEIITAILNVKGDITVRPEIVGGNSGIGWKYGYSRIDSEAEEGSVYAETPITTYADLGHSSTTDIRDVNKTAITISVVDFLRNQFAEGSQNIVFTFLDKTDFDNAKYSSNYGYGANCNKATLTIPVNICLRDNIPPTVGIKPFHWDSKENNSVVYHIDDETQAYIMEGHIELEEDWITTASYDSSATSGEYDKDPKVSGKIIVDCEANDNILISEIQMKVPGLNGSNDFFTIATRTDSGWNPVLNENWAFELVSDESSQENGNTVKWKFAFDSQKIDGMVKLDLPIETKVLDRGSPSLDDDDETIIYSGSIASALSTKQTTSNENTSYYKVDVVPYITKLTTVLGSYNNNLQRSTSGKYSVLDKETGILIHGFNIDASPKLYHSYYDSTADEIIKTELADARIANVKVQTIKNNEVVESIEKVISGINISELKSGALEIEITDSDENVISNLNNKNRNPVFDSLSSTGNKINAAAYNSMAIATSNNKLDDDVEILVWETKNIANKQSADLEHPVVKISPANGDIGASFLNQYFFNMPGKREEDRSATDWTTYTQTPFALGFTGYNSGTFAWDADGVSYGAYQNMVTDNAGQGGFFSFVIGRAKSQGTAPTATAFDAKTMTYSDAYRMPIMGVRLEGISTNLRKDTDSKNTTYSPYTSTFYNPEAWTFNTKRIMSPVIATNKNATGTGVYIAYADTTTNQIRLRRGTLKTSEIMNSTVVTTDISKINTAMQKAYSYKSSHIENNSLKDLYDFDTYYRLSNSYTTNYYVTGDIAKSYAGIYSYPYLNTEHKALRGTVNYQVEAADSLANLSGQTIHVIASSGAEVNNGEIADIYKKQSNLHNYKHSAGKYVGLDVTDNGTAVVAWHDEESDSLKLSYMTDSELQAAENDVKTKQKTTALDALTAPKLTTFSEGSYSIDPSKYNILGLAPSELTFRSALSGIGTSNYTRGIYKIKDTVEYKLDSNNNFVIDLDGNYVFVEKDNPENTVAAEDAYELDENGNRQFVAVSTSTDDSNTKLLVNNSITGYQLKGFTVENGRADPKFQTQLDYVNAYTEVLNKLHVYLLGFMEPLQKYTTALDSMITYYEFINYPTETTEYYNALINNERSSQEVLAASNKYKAYLARLTANSTIIKNILNGADDNYSTHEYYGVAKELSDYYENNLRPIINTFNTIASAAANTAGQGLKYFATNKYADAKDAIEKCLIAYYRTNDLASGISGFTGNIPPYVQYNDARKNLISVRDKFSTASGKNNGFFETYTQLQEEYSKSYRMVGDITYSTGSDSEKRYSTSAMNSVNRTKVWENHTKNVDEGGEYVQVVADSDNHIHMAYYSRGALKYAYMDSINSVPQVFTVDSVDTAGEYLTLNVGKDSEGRQIPYIGYYGNGHAKYAKFNSSYKSTGYADGCLNGVYTGAWDIVAVPTGSAVKRDNINVAVYVDNNGDILNIPAGEDIDVTNTNTAKPGNSTKVYGNGSSNPIVAYINKSGSLEMAQIK